MTGPTIDIQSGENQSRANQSATLGDLVEANIEGQKIGKAALADVDLGIALPDALGFALIAAETAWGRAGLLGAARVIQKSIERRPA